MSTFNGDPAFLQAYFGDLMIDGRRFTGDPAIENSTVALPMPAGAEPSIHERRIDAARIAAVSGAVRVAGIASTTLPRRRHKLAGFREFLIAHLIAAGILAIGAVWMIL